jgi:TrmH family RNA methyltransferase
MELCRTRGWTAVVVPQEILTSASDTMHPQSPIASIAVPDTGLMRSRDTLILRDISDPGNVGTMFRSAAAFGWDVCVSGSTTDPWSPKALRAGVGSHFGLHLSSSVDPIVEAHAAGLEILAAVVTGGGQVIRSDRPIALLVGSEAHGLPDEVARLADRLITLSLPGGVESLNAAVAASVLMYALN